MCTAQRTCAAVPLVLLALLSGCSNDSAGPEQSGTGVAAQPSQTAVDSTTQEVSPRGAVPIDVGEAVPVGFGQQPDWSFTIDKITRFLPGECPSELFDASLTDLPPDVFFLGLDMTVETFRFPPDQIFNPYMGTWRVVGASGTVDNDAATYSSYKCVDGEYSLTSPLPNSTYQLQTDVAATEQTGQIVLEHDGQRWEVNY